MVNGEKYKDIFTVVKWKYYCACNVHKFADDTNLHIFNALCIFLHVTVICVTVYNLCITVIML